MTHLVNQIGQQCQSESEVDPAGSKALNILPFYLFLTLANSFDLESFAMLESLNASESEVDPAGNEILNIHWRLQPLVQ